jgi:hypothetical protein
MYINEEDAGYVKQGKNDLRGRVREEKSEKDPG